MKKLALGDIELGKPLPWSVYDRNGNLLLRKGFVVSYAEQLARLLERGLYSGGGGDREASTEEAGQPASYQRIGAATLRLKALLNDLRSSEPSSDVLDRLRALARELAQAARQDPDAALAAAHQDFHNIYILAHQVHCAVLAALLAPRLNIGEEPLHALMCAALTCDLGMLDLHFLEKQKAPLDAAQLAELRRHPTRAVDILRRAGVKDALWLSIVADHHERPDGQGYPRGRGANETTPLAKVLAVLDAYLAMIKPRPWREARIPLTAMRELYGLKDSAVSGGICDALIKELGMYPPGSIVRLASNEIAVVGKRGPVLQQPEVYSIYERGGIPRMTPLRRDSQDPAYAVTAALSHQECRSAALIIARLWTGR